jgi:mannitol-specific phosphotransferase system IIBC component
VKEFVVYTLARIGLFAASFAIILGIWAAVTGTLAVLWAVVLAAVVSAVASYYLLRGPRERFAARVEDRAARMSRKIEESRTKEDVD